MLNRLFKKRPIIRTDLYSTGEGVQSWDEVPQKVRILCNAFIDAVNTSGVFDFSLESLKEIDLIADEIAFDIKDDRRRLGIILEAGAYVCETLKKNFPILSYADGKTIIEKNKEVDSQFSEKDVRIDLVVMTSGDSAIWPIQKLIKRVENGPGDSLFSYAQVLGKYLLDNKRISTSNGCSKIKN